MKVSVREKKRGSNNWYVFVHDTINRVVHRRAYKVGDKDEAEKLAMKIRSAKAIQDQGIIASPLDTFGDIANRWLESSIRPPLRSKSTYRGYSNAYNLHIAPTLGDKPLSAVRRSDLKALLLEKYRSGVNVAGIKTMANVLVQVARYAHEADVATQLDASRLYASLGIREQNNAEFIPFSLEESHSILAWIKENRPAEYPPIMVMFKTGMRVGEALSLQWDDISWSENKIKVCRSIDADNEVQDHTKTKQVRRVDVSATVTDELADLMPVEVDSPWCFQRDGKMMRREDLRSGLESALKELGIAARRLHDIRHTYASILLSSNVPMIYVKEQLGHASITTTVDRYGKYVPSTSRDYAAILDR